jgi:hypothetical protein
VAQAQIADVRLHDLLVVGCIATVVEPTEPVDVDGAVGGATRLHHEPQVATAVLLPAPYTPVTTTASASRQPTTRSSCRATGWKRSAGGTRPERTDSCGQGTSGARERPAPGWTYDERDKDGRGRGSLGVCECD